MIGLEKSFLMMYSKRGLNSGRKVPLTLHKADINHSYHGVDKSLKFTEANHSSQMKNTFQTILFINPFLRTRPQGFIGLTILVIKGTVSRELRPMLLYIIKKLFSRPIIAGHKIDIFIKGTLHNHQKTLQRK